MFRPDVSIVDRKTSSRGAAMRSAPPHVADDADDRHPGPVRRRRPEDHPLAGGILAGPVFVGERLRITLVRSGHNEFEIADVRVFDGHLDRPGLGEEFRVYLKSLNL